MTEETRIRDAASIVIALVGIAFFIWMIVDVGRRGT